MDMIFVAGFGLTVALLLVWGFKTLPGEKWQMIGALPVKKNPDGLWQAVNLTYYGFFNAMADTVAVALFMVLMGAMHIPVKVFMIISALLMGICLPASRIIARVVEKKAYTASVAGAAFVGLLFLPWSIQLLQAPLRIWLYIDIQVIPSMAAAMVAFALGEGIGRLACISFGCCYGKRLDSVSPVIRKIFTKYYFVFSGKTRKIVYAGDLEGIAVIPVQGITATISCAAGWFGLLLLLKGHYTASFLITLTVTHLWRFCSEFLRADYRGETGISLSAYQIMAALSVIYAAVLIFLFPITRLPPVDIVMGLKALWHPAVILSLQFLGVISFVHSGKSKVTESLISFHVAKERV